MTIAIVIMAITLVFRQITKLTKIDNKWLPLENIIIATIASIVCIIFKVENISALETIVTCIFATMSSGGMEELGKMTNNIRKDRMAKLNKNEDSENANEDNKNEDVKNENIEDEKNKEES